MQQQNISRKNLAMTLDDLQSAWSCLREAVLYGVPAELQPTIINQIAEGTRWDQVYDLSEMQKTFKTIAATVQQASVDKEVKVWMGHVQATLAEALIYTQGQ